MTLGELKEEIDRMLSERPSLALTPAQVSTDYGGADDAHSVMAGKRFIVIRGDRR